jgi:hypothetical protein
MMELAAGVRVVDGAIGRARGLKVINRAEVECVVGKVVVIVTDGAGRSGAMVVNVGRANVREGVVNGELKGGMGVVVGRAGAHDVKS